MILVVNNSKNLYKANMTPKLLKILDSWNIQYHIINKKKDFKKKTFKENKNKFKGIILSGGPLCISDNPYYKDIVKNISAIQLLPGIPVLGICFGFQIICDIFGGYIDKLHYHNLGFKKINVEHSDMQLFKNINDTRTFFFSHNDQITQIPNGFKYFMHNNIVIYIKNIEKKIYGVQFHPEGSTDGHMIIKTFIFNIAYF